MARWGLLLGIVFATACRDRPPDYGPNWVEITYNNGQTCVRQNWTFTYGAAYRPPDVKRGATITRYYSDRYLSAKDSTLRIHDASGKALAIPPGDLSEIRRTLDCDPGANEPPPEPVDIDEKPWVVPGPRPNCRVLRTHVVAEGLGEISVGPMGPYKPRKKNSRRVLMPVAQHFWPEVYKGNPQKYEKVSIKLEGTPTEGCAHAGVVNLSVIQTSAPTAQRLEFHAL